MALQEIQVTHVRNLAQVRLRDLGRVNVFYGHNGSGKTSILEAIHLLGLARSFRTSNIRSVISHDRADCTVYAEVEGRGPMSVRRLGVKRDRTGGIELRLDRELQSSRAELAAVLPLQIVHSESFMLISGSPRIRRQFIDWGVFHVEQSYAETWQRFQKALKQRNHLLRHGRIDQLDFWDEELARCGSLIHEARQAYLVELSPVFQQSLSAMDAGHELPELVYRAGWDTTHALGEALGSSRASDVKQGFTQPGPQRADVRFVISGKQASEVLSRGQQKLVLMALKLAQALVLARDKRMHCAFLIDDLPAEFDARRQAAVIEQLGAMQAQVFLTSIEREDIPLECIAHSGRSAAMFHVEHGRLSRTH